MGFTECSKSLRFSFVLLIAADVFLIFGVALPYWYDYEEKIENVEMRTELGLWQYCNVTFVTTKCADITDDMAEDWLKATRSLMILCVILIIVDVVIISIVLFKFNDSKLIRLIGSIGCVVTFVLLLTGVSVYGAKQKVEGGKLSGSFGIAVVSIAFAVGASVLSLVDWFGMKT